VSPVILEEYVTVLQRPKFNLNPSRVNFLLDLIDANSVLVEPEFRVSASPHDADNRFLECAEAAGARYLVTGNKRHFPTSWKNTEIVNARELRRRLALA
jgi:predicted nucleic acid-binding protein